MARSNESTDEPTLHRLDRPANLVTRVEQLLRRAIAEGQFVDGRLPTEVELAEQLGVSRETVRLAADNLQAEGLLVKIRRKGTFLKAPALPDRIEAARCPVIGYLQAGYLAGTEHEEAVSRQVGGLILQGAIEEASSTGRHLLAVHSPSTQMRSAFENLRKSSPLCGLIFAHYGEEKLLRRAAGLGIPIVLLDHDLELGRIASVRDDSFEAARLAVRYLAERGHRRIAFVNWRREELNPWRLQGYRKGLRDVGLPRRRSWEVSTELTPAGAADAVRQIADMSPRPSAAYCFNNSLAILIIAELERLGLRVPGDISVLGGGGENVAGLACHQTDWHHMGRLAVQILARNEATPESHRLAHEIREGGSVAPINPRASPVPMID